MKILQLVRGVALVRKDLSAPYVEWVYFALSRNANLPIGVFAFCNRSAAQALYPARL